MYLSFNMPELRKPTFISPVSFAKTINYLNHVICNGSVSSSSWVTKLVRTDFCKWLIGSNKVVNNKKIEYRRTHIVRAWP